MASVFSFVILAKARIFSISNLWNAIDKKTLSLQIITLYIYL